MLSNPIFIVVLFSVNHGDRYCYRVRNLEHLQQKIIPFFEKHKLLTSKRIDFEKFRRVCLLMERKQHLCAEGVEEFERFKAQ